MGKTDYIGDLFRTGTHYFLSRPRRFGKSLLVSTLHSLFECERELFTGLAIGPHWDWSDPHPVVHVDLSGVALGGTVVPPCKQPLASRRAVRFQCLSDGWPTSAGPCDVVRYSAGVSATSIRGTLAKVKFNPRPGSYEVTQEGSIIH